MAEQPVVEAPTAAEEATAEMAGLVDNTTFEPAQEATAEVETVAESVTFAPAAAETAVPEAAEATAAPVAEQADEEETTQS